MTTDELYFLEYYVSEYPVSVMHYGDSKAYLFYTPVSPDEERQVFIHCSYKMAMGIPFMHCTISYADSKEYLEDILVPLDAKKRNEFQNEVMYLVNMCSKKVIAQEMARNKVAIAGAINSLAANKEYS